MFQLIFRLTMSLTLGLMLWLPQAAPVAAQGDFSPAIVVNDSVITRYELAQRALMLQLLNAPGNVDELAREQLIDDRLRLAASSAAGIVPSTEEVLEGMDEFAGRANLTREEFVQALGGAGVSEQTFRDFVTAGLAWRQLIQARFGGRSAASRGEIERALAGRGGGSGIRVLISEIIMPAPPPQAEAVRQRAIEIARTRSPEQFSAAARQFSVTPSRAQGGRLDWQNLEDLPPQLRPLILALAPGQVTDPLPIPNAVALFQLRAIEETDFQAAEVGAVEYAAYYMPGGRSADTLAKARVLASRVDRCDDLYGVARDQPEDVLERGTLPPAQLPTDIAIELSKLDPGEVSTVLTRSNGQTLVFLMLCGRTAALSDEVDEDNLALGLRNRRLANFADSFLAQLRSDARIVER